MKVSRPVLWTLLAAVAAASMSFYTVKIWSANQPSQFSDLYATWWAAHELFLHRRNPYSPAVAHEIQTVIYGAPSKPSPNDPAGIGGGFAYPPYAAFLAWPIILVSFPAAQKIFLGISILATLSSVWFWMQALRFRVTPPLFCILAIFTLGSFPALQAIKLQNPSLIAAAFIAVALFLLSTDRLILAGIALAASTFKPQFVILLIPWLALWAIASWRKRGALLWSFLASMFVLCLTSQWLIPGWISSFLGVVRAYRHYTYGHSLLDVWFRSNGEFFAAGIVIAVVAYCWRYRSQPAGSLAFSRVISLLLAATLVVIPTLAPHAQLLLIPGFFCLLRDRSALPANTPARLSSAAWVLLAWPWIAALGLLLPSLMISPAALLQFWQLPLYVSPVLPLALLCALASALHARSFDTVTPVPA